ncbi:hypothetical protein ECE50_020995 [Chitinophaga sp. Mgbs1]|uniref:Uncharacterized protein n=1 Tax=Chitinophaga solisilvae TaxID=1233460 RepID=A0A9Q5GS82_9BACT|nr:hypothetical protein [Chitinophaga solisilvae]
MDVKLLELHISQAQLSLNRACNNNYSDNNKAEYQDTLVALFDKIKENFSSKQPGSDIEIIEIKKELDFIFQSLESLDSSTLNLIPYEMVACLKCAMDEWLVKGEKFIIVTRLINELTGFSFDPSIAFNDQLFRSIKQKYSIDIVHRLVQISIPKALSRDYLAAVPLYHELGHFIDIKNNITSSLEKHLVNLFFSYQLPPATQTELLSYFPFLPHYHSNPKMYEFVFQRHLGEYFCDLFASQYVGRSLNLYLEYITEQQNYPVNTHPSTTFRIKVVEDFLSNNKNVIIYYLIDAIKQVTGMDLSIRYTPPSKNDFLHFLPVDIQNERELHGLFSMGWDLWLNNWDAFSKNMNMVQPIKREQVYSVINNLIEKSISNYFINQKWKLALSQEP